MKARELESYLLKNGFTLEEEYEATDEIVARKYSNEHIGVVIQIQKKDL